ncbi:MAG TPA: hypothetical protein PLY93_01805 [Turneriella sp.]|nr:hypothetical protein [Turneriella sp.]
MIKVSLRCLYSAAFFIPISIVFAAPQPAAKSGLAVVAIPQYIDTTASKNYGYLSGSLTDAVNQSMQEKFDYSRANQTAVDAKTKQLWKKNQTPTDLEIKQLAISTQSDYVVVGSYSLTPNKKQIVFNTRIYIAPDKFISIAPLTNNADATLFDATNKVATEIVKEIEREALARATAQKSTPTKEGEKIALSKNENKSVAPAPKKEDDSYNYLRENDKRHLNITAGYASNTVERQALFYQYPASAMYLRADARLQEELLLYAHLTWPSTDVKDTMPTNYKNNANQTIGLEYGNRNEGYMVGLNYRNFSGTNPAGIFQRDLLNWSSSLYMKTSFHIFNIQSISFGLDLDSYMDIFSIKQIDPTLSTTESDVGLLWNVEAAVRAGYYFSPLGVFAVASVGGAYSIIDSTNRPMNAALTQTIDRSMSFVGLRYSMSLQKWFKNIRLKIAGYLTPSLGADYQYLNSKNEKQTSLAYFDVSATYQFEF